MVGMREHVAAFGARPEDDPQRPLPTPQLAPTEPESFETEGAPVDPRSGVPVTWDGVLAFIVSQVLSPAVLAIAMVMWVAAVSGAAGAWWWAAVYLLASIGAPVVYLLILLRRGWVTDLDVQVRAQRVRPMQFLLGASAIAWLILAIGGAPTLLLVLAGALTMVIAFNYAITLRWKISMHTTFIAAAGTLTWTLTGLLLPLLLGVPLVAWARVRLGRHTTAQTIAGGAMGFAVLYVARYLAYRYAI